MMEKGTGQKIEISNHIAIVQQIGFEAVRFDLTDPNQLKAFQETTDFMGLGVVALQLLAKQNPDSQVIHAIRSELVSAAEGKGIDWDQLPQLILSALANSKDTLRFDI